MNSIKFFALALLLGAAFALGSCNKDDDDGGGSGTSDVYLNCKIDGVDFAAEPLTVGGTSSSNSLSVQGNGSGLSASAITMTLNSTYTGVGTYGFGSNHFFNTATYLPLATNPADAYLSALAGGEAGQIVVTLDDGEYVEGTFSFDGAGQLNSSQTVSITEGEFRLKLP